ncbi:MAG: TetR/AcrR family transcriptional regulator, partial [Pseudomonadota bacterium]|nr:TetR/AcrR family transcriptional regulator [Pseudomonadota bacterium]
QESRKRFMRLARSLATQTCHALALKPREAFVLIELNGAIPEALARLVRSGEIDQETAAQTCERLIAASLQSFALRPTH